MNHKDVRIAIVATDYFEESELIQPLRFLEATGAQVDVIAPHNGEIEGLRHVDPGQHVSVDITLDLADPSKYDAVVLPGGALNADKLRMDQKARDFVTAIMEAGKPVAAICHAPWLLVSSDLLLGKRLTSYHTIQDDVQNAGGEWVDKEVVVDGNLITSRKPADIPAFNQAIIKALEGND